MASLTKEVSDENTVTTLNHLADKRYKVSKKKFQISQTRVTYTGFILTEGQRRLHQEQKEAICSLTHPKSRRQFRGFLGMAGCCRIWILNYGLNSKASI